MKHIILALCILTPIKVSIASVSASFGVNMTIIPERLPPKVTKIKLSAERVMIVNEW
ncbi:hypothetical protein GJV11_03600 [Enterobacteriaceae bacterium RIT693]|jgi:hypothetical protein|nr:hypothetical protein [Enterobacteriaceae bacterium RIT693]